MDQQCRVAYAALILLAFSLVHQTYAHADTFGFGSSQFDIEFVPVGNSGNPDDLTGDPNLIGNVDYAYRIGKYEISEDMINKSGLEITHDNRGANKPATSISWYEAAQLVNWLNTSSGHMPA